jgi:transposase-like protein
MQTVLEIVALTSNNQATITFLRSKGILRDIVECSSCGNCMQTVMDKSRNDGCFFRCYPCKKMLSIRTGSFFSRSKLTLGQLLIFVYFWTLKISTSAIAAMLGISEHSAVDWSNLIREVCTAKFLNERNPSLGGTGHIVQIDESVIYKPKHHRGHALAKPSKWIFGLYDVTQKIGAIEFVENRSADVLLPLIRKHVIPGTEIHSDQWAAYAGVGSIDVDPPFIHKTVNHSLHFKDPTTGIHTNNVEAYWCSIKRKFKILNGTSRALTASYLDEHMYRERYGRTNEDMFSNILKDIGELGF